MEGNASDGAQQPPDENAMLFPIFVVVFSASSSVGQAVRLCKWAWQQGGRRWGSETGVG